MLSSAPDIAHEDQFPDILNYVHIENRTKGFSGIFSNGQRFIYLFFFFWKNWKGKFPSMTVILSL